MRAPFLWFESTTIIAAEALPPPDGVKIDVEGMEVRVLRGMERTLQAHQPDLFIEIHGADERQKVENARGIIDFLVAAGYRRLLHVEAGAVIGPGNAAAAREGHLWASARDGAGAK